ncbi:MAG: SPFH domain-containing protein [Pseudomonadota bacterium]
MSEIRAKSGSGAGFGIMMILFAVAFIVIPFMFEEVAGVSRLILVGFGVVMLLLGSIVIIITRLYVRTAADEAFVRTGMGGQKVIIDGGAIVIPVVHKVVPVSLATMRLDVERKDQDALITGDKLRADIKAEFYIKVQKDREAVVNAATSLGERSINASTVKELVNEKLISALRTVAATRSLEDLNAKRDEFADAVQKIVSSDLRHNGLTLESVTVSQLDQTPPDKMKAESNIFDAQGTRQIAEITQQMRAETNALEREADKSIKKQDVEKDQFVYEQEIARASAEARQNSEIEKAQAEAQQKAATFTAEQDELARVREVKRDEAVSVANVVREQRVQVANVERERAQQVADMERQKAIAKTAEERAKAEAAQKLAEAEREAADQQVKTVAVTEEAKRTAEKAYIDKARQIDQEAYQTERQAEALRKAAEKEAEARKLKAAAEMDALIAEAAGEQAKQMVPVSVEKEKVAVEQKRINDVLQPELKAKAEFKEISVQLEVKLKEIEVNGDVQKAFATAMGQSLASAKMNIFGDPGTMSRMMNMFNRGQSVSTLVEGFGETMDPNALKKAGDMVTDIGESLGGILHGLFGKRLPADSVDAVAAQLKKHPETIAHMRTLLAQGASDLKLAALLVKVFGDDFDLKTTAAFIEALRKDPAILDKIGDIVDKFNAE